VDNKLVAEVVSLMVEIVRGEQLFLTAFLFLSNFNSGWIKEGG